MNKTRIFYKQLFYVVAIIFLSLSGEAVAQPYDDLSAFELKGPVKTIRQNGKTYHFDEHGQLLAQDGIDSIRHENGRLSYFCLDVFNPGLFFFLFASTDHYTYSFSYNSDGHLQKKESSHNGKISSVEDFTWEDGRVNKINGSISIFPYHLLEYLYDTHGNWIKRLDYKKGIEEDRYYTDSREITYWDETPCQEYRNIDSYISQYLTYEKQKDYNSALQAVRKAAEYGDRDAQFITGMFYYDSPKGIQRSEDRAKFWFEQAASQGHISAHYFLAVMTYSKNVPYAYEHSLIAAEAGDADAQLLLANIYDEGYEPPSYIWGEKAIPVDKKEAFKWFLKSAQGGCANAMLEVSGRYADGEGVEANANAAAYWERCYNETIQALEEESK